MPILVIDIGSSSVRALIFDDTARPIPGAVASLSHTFDTDSTGAVTADVLALRQMTETCIDSVLKHPVVTAQPDSIRAVGMAVFVGNILGVDRNGNPLTPIYTYADTRSFEDVALLRNQVDADELVQRTGCRLHTAYLPGRLHWLRRTQPQLYDSVAQWIDLGTYLYRQWFGLAASSYSTSAWTGMLNRQELTWDEAWLNTLEVSADKLPNLADYTATLAGLRPEYAQRWAVLKSIRFYLAVGDGAAANIGAGAVDETAIALTVGTTAALRIVSRNFPTVPDGLWSYRVDAHHHLTGGATSEGGNIFQWVSQTLALPKSTEQALTEREADAHGLTWLPLLAGERSPGWNSQATGTIHGLRLSTTSLDILQAALEGVANRLALIADQLAALQDTDEILPVRGGGGALEASPAWAQIICNALNRPLYLLGESEVTARGVAILVLRALDRVQLSAFPPREVAMLTPQPEAVEKLRIARQRQINLYQLLYRP